MVSIFYFDEIHLCKQNTGQTIHASQIVFYMHCDLMYEKSETKVQIVIHNPSYSLNHKFMVV